MTSEPGPVPEPCCEDLLRRIDRAVGAAGADAVCRAIKSELIAYLESHQDFLPASALAASSDCYARHLLHRDPEGRYSAVVMVWAPGQTTPLHDHDGRWCVECVYRGRIRVTSYEHDGDASPGCCRFTRQTEVIAGRGEAGMLIPPFEYHTIDNPFDEQAVTLHVYRGELSACHVYVPRDDGSYLRERRELCYS